MSLYNLIKISSEKPLRLNFMGRVLVLDMRARFELGHKDNVRLRLIANCVVNLSNVENLVWQF